MTKLTSVTLILLCCSNATLLAGHGFCELHDIRDDLYSLESERPDLQHFIMYY
jgi:hypothetical protein